MNAPIIGQPVSRVDGRQKTTGAATYAAEFEQTNVAHAAILRSTVASGRLTVDTSLAERAPGVIAVLTHRNAPKLPYRPHKGAVDPEMGERLHVLQDDRVTHQGQPIGSSSRRQWSRPCMRRASYGSPTGRRLRSPTLRAPKW